MPYLVDSDIATDHLASAPEAVRLLDGLAGDGIAISIITYVELYQGAERGPDSLDAHVKLRAFLENVPILPLSLPVAERCALLREALRRQNKRVRSRALDLLIAATALEHNLTLVTRNVDDYKDIPRLILHSI